MTTTPAFADKTEHLDRSALQPPRRRERRPVRLSPQPSELQVHIAIAGHLRHRAVAGLFWFHPPNGELRDKATAAKLKAMGTKAGVPDFVLLHRGRLHGLEIKRHDGRVSTEQHVARREIEAAGGIWAVAHGVDEALAVLRAWGLLKTAEPVRAAMTATTDEGLAA